MIFDRTDLPSGIRVLSEKMPEVRSATIGFWIGVGSRDEPAELQGSSHFLEHLLFKGTERRTAKDIAESFDAVGGEANAYSAKEYTCFYARVLDKDLHMATEVLTDILIAPKIIDEDVESERNVILEEIAMHEDTPEDLVHDVFIETLYGVHPLGREVMGTTETVKRINAASLRDFHVGNYHAGNIVVSAAGNIDHDDLVASIDSAFVTKGASRVVRAPVVPEAMSSLRVLDRKTEQAHLVIGGMGYSREHPMRWAWGVLDNLLGGGMSSRLFQEIREKRGLAYNVYSYRNSFSETGSWAVYAGSSPSTTQQLIGLIYDELDRLVEAGITQRDTCAGEWCLD
ncbi:MAG: insulinase family protein [Actinobacteria bacterium]|nr:insulinase family protein [Actinomycetota bacterium]